MPSSLGMPRSEITATMAESASIAAQPASPSASSARRRWCGSPWRACCAPPWSRRRSARVAGCPWLPPAFLFSPDNSKDATHWRTRRPNPEQPSDWVVRWAPLVERGPVLDVACGGGRHARLFAGRGLEVVAVDREAQALPGRHPLRAGRPGGRQPLAVRRAALRRHRGHQLPAPAAVPAPRASRWTRAAC